MNRFLNRSTLCWAFVLVCLCISGAGTAFAFDGNRAGFILGIGAGGGYARHALSIDSSDFGISGFSIDVSQSNFAVKTDFLIGYAPSNRLAITLSSKISWYSVTYRDDDDAIEDAIIASDTAGLGITYFLSENINANFIQAVIGFNYVSEPFEEEGGSSRGFGLGIGVGREVSKNWIIGLDATWGRPESDFTTFGIGVYFSHIWY